MPKRMKVERSPNYSYYSDILWCSLPLVGMSCYFYGLRPVLLFLAAAADRLPVRLRAGTAARHGLPVP